MAKTRGFLSILVPAATVFISSACIMVLELVAGRLIARHLGSSLYTWTSVIGVVLAGISVGNYIGGQLADRFAARKTLAVLFGFCSASCVAVVILNNLTGNWIFLWRFNWPLRVFSHVSLVFFLPSTLLGTISPVVAKMALDRGLSTGRTVGDIYAWSAAGSIAGTFLAGFYLIATMGTVAIIWTLGAVLLLMAILYWSRLWILYVWAAVFIALLAMGTASFDWAQSTGSPIGLRKKPDPSVLYKDESQYCYITVEQLSKEPDIRRFSQDNTKTQSLILMGDIKNLRSEYEQIFAAVTQRLSKGRNRFSILAIGGGGYVFPRYAEAVWPGSHIDVAEIDPGVTAAAMAAFGLEENSSINNYNMDARNYIDELLEEKRRGGDMQCYDFIYGDAFNNDTIPYQLATKEFNDKIKSILADDGAYMINIIDVYDSGLFLGAMLSTLEKTFGYIYVISEAAAHNKGNNYLVIAVNREINLEGLGTEEPVRNLDLCILSKSKIDSLQAKANRLILTDDYAPIEELIEPFIFKRARNSLAAEYLKQAGELKAKGNWQESIERYKDAIKADASVSISAYSSIGGILAEQGMWQEALEAGKSALDYNTELKTGRSLSDVHFNIGLALKELGKGEEANIHLTKAIEGYRKKLAQEPESITTISNLGEALAENGDFEQAANYLRQALELDPFSTYNHQMLAKVLMMQLLYDEAAEHLRSGIEFMLENGRNEDAAELQILFQRYFGKRKKQ